MRTDKEGNISERRGVFIDILKDVWAKDYGFIVKRNIYGQIKDKRFCIGCGLCRRIVL